MLFAWIFSNFGPIVITIVATIFKQHIVATPYPVGIARNKLHALRYYTAETGKVLNLYTQISATTGRKTHITDFIFYTTGRAVFFINHYTLHHRIAKSTYRFQINFHNSFSFNRVQKYMRPPFKQKDRERMRRFGVFRANMG